MKLVHHYHLKNNIFLVKNGLECKCCFLWGIYFLDHSSTICVLSGPVVWMNISIKNVIEYQLGFENYFGRTWLSNMFSQWLLIKDSRVFLVVKFSSLMPKTWLACMSFGKASVQMRLCLTASSQPTGASSINHLPLHFFVQPPVLFLVQSLIMTEYLQ